MNKTFFVVEDHTLTNIGIRHLLKEKKNLTCLGFASNKIETLFQLAELNSQNNLPQIITLDLFLGDDSGIDLLKEIKEKYPNQKVLVYSMYENPGIVSLVLENKADGFVQKSSPESELLKAVTQILSGETYIQPNLISPLFVYKTLFDGLTRQEQTILKKVIERKTNHQIATELNITLRSVENYMSRIYMKTDCKNHEQLIKTFG